MLQKIIFPLSVLTRKNVLSPQMLRKVGNVFDIFRGGVLEEELIFTYLSSLLFIPLVLASVWKETITN